MTKLYFTERYYDAPQGSHGPTTRYREGKTYDVSDEVAARALASGRARRVGHKAARAKGDTARLLQRVEDDVKRGAEPGAEEGVAV